MEPDLKYRNILYRLIIGQLHHDGHNKLALDLSNSIGMDPSPPPSDTLSRMVSAAWLIENDADGEEMDIDMQMSLNPVALPIDNLPIDEEYFPFLALLPELKDQVFSYLSIKDRMRARVTKNLVEIEANNKYHVEELIIEERNIREPSPWLLKSHPNAQFMVILKNESYSSDCIRRIAHNASIGFLLITLSGSSEFHREVCNLIKEIDIRRLVLLFKNKDLEKEVTVESFILDLTRSCKSLSMRIDNVTPETIHEVYKVLLDGSTKLRIFGSKIEKEKCISFLRLIGIAYRDDTFFSNRNIEVYKMDYEHQYNEEWNIFDGYLEMVLEVGIVEENERGYFNLIRHETLESLEEAKNKEGMERIEIGPE